MSNKINRFILKLPGVNSYCNCETNCSRIEVEHVMPKKMLKKTLDYDQFKVANQDAHNLYKCCHMLNAKKGTLILGDKYLAYEFSGMLARSCLYMNSTYKLKFNDDMIKKWKNLSLFYPPFHFEYSRSKIIYRYTGKYNPFIDEYNKD